MLELKKGGSTVVRSDSTPNIVLLDQSKQSPRPLLSGLHLPEFIDIGGVKTWIRDCEMDHQATCGASADLYCPFLPSDFAVIDVTKYLFGKPSKSLHRVNHQGTRYVALSYVWEQGLKTLRDHSRRRHEQVSKGGVPLAQPDSRTDLSPTITDAVELCRRLGERYLWVDRLCVSKDPKERKHQISQMDSIYSHAVFTIVAAQDHTSFPGLPGVVSNRPQQAQRDKTELVCGKMLTLSKPSLSSYLSRSSWKTRGWTHQEGLLSRRCLIFTDDEVFWCCHRCLRRESLGHVPTNSSLPSLSAFEPSSDNITSRDLGSKWEYLTYARLVSEFSKRKLTLESDALPAFSGLSNLLSRRFGIQFLSGIPLPNLLTGLCWFGSTRLSRRTKFPSWSWAGWSGFVHQDYYIVRTPLENNSFASLALVEPLHGGRYLRVKSQIAQIALSHRQNLENEPHYFARRTTHFIQSYLPRPQGRSSFDMSVPLEFDMKRHQATHGACEFLMLARVRDSDFIKLTKFDIPNVRPEYILALFIDRSGDHARRVGLLSIPAKIWDDASPQAAAVILE